MVMNYDPAQCLANLNSKQLGPACQNLINPFHCDDVVGLDPGYHATCATAGIYYFPIICMVCHNAKTDEYKYFPSVSFFNDCNALYKKDSNWEPARCYCCCSCLANDTMIAVPTGQVAIYTIKQGEQVITGSTSGAGRTKLTWSPAPVRFSMGTGSGGHQPLMVYIVFGDGAEQQLICNTDQPFLLSDGKLITAGRLRPGQQLLDHDGRPLTVQLVSVGEYSGGVHHIATDVPWTGSADGHLILAAGVVAGDYTLQTHFAQVQAELKVDNHDALPLIGTPEFDSAHTHKGKLRRADAVFEFVQSGAPSPGSTERQLTSGVFRTYRTSVGNVPFGAQAFLTPEQANDIMTNGSQAPLSNPIPFTLFNTIKAQLSGFFPDIHFYYDTLDITPSVYAFEAYGEKIVQVSGGLARMKGFNYEGLFMAMAHGVGCFYGGAPKNGAGYSAVGQADSYAFAVVSRLNWVGAPFLSYVMQAMAQWQALFALVNPGNAVGNPKDPLNDPALACRIQAIQSAAAGGPLPECAGGEPLQKIALQRAVASSTTRVTLTFSLAINSETGTNTANYTLDPAATLTSATLDSSTGFIVHLEAALAPNTQYQVSVQNLVSIIGTGLDPAHVSASFTTPPA